MPSNPLTPLGSASLLALSLVVVGCGAAASDRGPASGGAPDSTLEMEREAGARGAGNAGGGPSSDPSMAGGGPKLGSGIPGLAANDGKLVAGGISGGSTGGGKAMLAESGCPGGRLDLGSACCWPGQSAAESGCSGAPQCPSGYAALAGASACTLEVSKSEALETGCAAESETACVELEFARLEVMEAHLAALSASGHSPTDMASVKPWIEARQASLTALESEATALIAMRRPRGSYHGAMGLGLGFETFAEALVRIEFVDLDAETQDLVTMQLDELAVGLFDRADEAYGLAEELAEEAALQGELAAAKARRAALQAR